MTGTVRMKAPVPRTSQLSAIPAHQRRQNALQGCLQACVDLGFFDEAGQDGQSAETRDLSQQACDFVEISYQLAHRQAELEFKRDQAEYGDLLRPTQLEAKAVRLDEAYEALEFVTKHQERLTKFLQQPHSGPSLMVESGFQQYVLRVLQLALQDVSLLSQGTQDLDWVMQFKEPSTAWTKLLQPTPQVTAVISQYHEGLAALQGAVEKLALLERAN